MCRLQGLAPSPIAVAGGRPAWPLLGLSWLDVRARAGTASDTGQGLKRACRADKADKGFQQKMANISAGAHCSRVNRSQTATTPNHRIGSERFS